MMTEESKNTPKTGTTNGKSTKSRATRTFTEADVPMLIKAIAAVPKRRKTYSSRQMLQRLRTAIYEGVRSGRSVDDIFMAIAPMLHVNRQTFDAVLGVDELSNIEAKALPAIEITATEIHNADVTPTPEPANGTVLDSGVRVADSASAPASVPPAARSAS